MGMQSWQRAPLPLRSIEITYLAGKREIILERQSLTGKIFRLNGLARAPLRASRQPMMCRQDTKFEPNPVDSLFGNAHMLVKSWLSITFTG
jgi:hypothetical protein